MLKRAWGVVVLMLAAAACAPALTVRTDFDRSVSFSQFRTFRVGTGQVLESGSIPPNTIVKDRIDKALWAQMAGKGFQPVAERDADLVVRYAAGARTVQELQAIDYPAPYWVGAYPGDFWVQEYPEGTLVIDLYDGHTNKLVWRAYCRAEGAGFTDPAFIQKTVAKAFASFPPPA
jgi:hypothetical protein